MTEHSGNQEEEDIYHISFEHLIICHLTAISRARLLLVYSKYLFTTDIKHACDLAPTLFTVIFQQSTSPAT